MSMRSSPVPYSIQILNQLKIQNRFISSEREISLSTLFSTVVVACSFPLRYLVRVTEAMYETNGLNEIFLYNVSLRRVRWGGNWWEFVSPSGNVRPTSEGVGGLSQCGFAIVGHGRILLYLIFDDSVCSRGVAFNHSSRAVEGL